MLFVCLYITLNIILWDPCVYTYIYFQKSLIWATTLSQIILNGVSTARIKIASSLLSSWQILSTLSSFFPHSLIYEVHWSISSASNKGLLKDVLLNLFSQPWGHTITAVHSCFACLGIGRTRVLSVIVTAFPWKRHVCPQFSLCPPPAVESASPTLSMWLQKQVVALLSW